MHNELQQLELQLELKQRLLDAAAEPYRSRINDYYWARGKLSGDPIFTALIERSVLPDDAYIVDLGCGRGLLAAWLLAAEALVAEKIADESAWYTAVAPPQGLRFRGIELDQRRAARCHRMLQSVYGDRVELIGGDMRTADMSGADAITILDALHYIPHADQEQLLDRVRAALGPGGLFVTRVGDAAGGWRFEFSQLVDRCVASIQTRQLVSTWCRPLTEWLSLIEARGFRVDMLPMSNGTLFANVLLVCRAV